MKEEKFYTDYFRGLLPFINRPWYNFIFLLVLLASCFILTNSFLLDEEDITFFIGVLFMISVTVCILVLTLIKFVNNVLKLILLLRSGRDSIQNSCICFALISRV